MVYILDFLFVRFYLILIYKSPWCSLPSFESFGLSVQEKKRKKSILKMAAIAATLDFRLERFFATCDLQVTPCFLPSFKSIGLSDQEKKRNIDVQENRSHERWL